MYHTYHRRPRNMGSYFLPFLSLIIIGLIVVLVFQIVDYFQNKKLKELENKAAVEVVAGRAEMKIWGVDQWTAAINGSILNEGDIIKTGPGSRIILTLLNGSVIRIDSESEVELTGLKSRDAQDEAEFALHAGEIWLKRSESQTVRSAFAVSTPHLMARSIGSIFNVETGATEAVQVLSEKVRVEVLIAEDDGGKMRTAETVEVAMGQEVSITSEDIFDLQNRRSVSLLSLLSDDFREGGWYKWNRNEDSAGVVGISVEDAVKQREDDANQPIVEPEPQEVVTNDEPSPIEVEMEFGAPVILTPVPGERVSTSGNIVVTGTTSSKTNKLEVTTYVAGSPEKYILQRYTPGSTNWSYVASREYANFVPGVNRYSVVAIASDGKRSDPLEFTLTYDKEREPADLSAPAITGYGDIETDATSFPTEENELLIRGSIGKGIVKVFVNDFALTRYVPDSGVWSYYAKTVYNNLAVGENTYSVYGVDSEGNRTSVLRFVISKSEKPEEPETELSTEEPATAEPIGDDI